MIDSDVNRHTEPNRKAGIHYPRKQQGRRKAAVGDTKRPKKLSGNQESPAILGTIIAEGRKRLGWSQAMLAESARLNEKTISNVETGATRNPETLRDLRNLLDRELLKNGEKPLPWPSLETVLTLRETSGIRPLIAASRISTLGRNAGYEHLIGRDSERQALDFAWSGDAAAWQNAFNQHVKRGQKLTGQHCRPRIIVFNAWAGIGKTALVVRWAVDKLAEDNHSGIERYFDWSFYNQGTRQENDTTSSGNWTSADPFLKNALEFFGDSALAASNDSPWQKGERLAQLINQHRTLLILDGLESLQDAMTGELRDDGVRALVRALASQNRGLCLLTTRQHVAELAVWLSCCLAATLRMPTTATSVVSIESIFKR